MPPPSEAADVAKKHAKFNEDFIIISEFSEQVGPVPLVSRFLRQPKLVWNLLSPWIRV